MSWPFPISHMTIELGIYGLPKCRLIDIAVFLEKRPLNGKILKFDFDTVMQIGVTGSRICFQRFCFRNFRDEASVIIQRYTVCCQLFSDPKMRDLE